MNENNLIWNISKEINVRLRKMVAVFITEEVLLVAVGDAMVMVVGRDKVENMAEW